MVHSQSIKSILEVLWEEKALKFIASEKKLRQCLALAAQQNEKKLVGMVYDARNVLRSVQNSNHMWNKNIAKRNSIQQ